MTTLESAKRLWRQIHSVQRTWRPVPVREKPLLYATHKRLTGSDYAETGEWKCVAANDETFDLGSRRSYAVESCNVYHRSREVAERHCVKLTRGSSY